VVCGTREGDFRRRGIAFASFALMDRTGSEAVFTKTRSLFSHLRCRFLATAEKDDQIRTSIGPVRRADRLDALAIRRDTRAIRGVTRLDRAVEALVRAVTRVDHAVGRPIPLVTALDRPVTAPIPLVTRRERAVALTIRPVRPCDRRERVA
jgi:hypothetical protein